MWGGHHPIYIPFGRFKILFSISTSELHQRYAEPKDFPDISPSSRWSTFAPVDSCGVCMGLLHLVYLKVLGLCLRKRHQLPVLLHRLVNIFSSKFKVMGSSQYWSSCTTCDLNGMLLLHVQGMEHLSCLSESLHMQPSLVMHIYMCTLIQIPWCPAWPSPTNSQRRITLANPKCQFLKDANPAYSYESRYVVRSYKLRDYPYIPFLRMGLEPSIL